MFHINYQVFLPSSLPRVSAALKSIDSYFSRRAYYCTAKQLELQTSYIFLSLQRRFSIAPTCSLIGITMSCKKRPLECITTPPSKYRSVSTKVSDTLVEESHILSDAKAKEKVLAVEIASFSALRDTDEANITENGLSSAVDGSCSMVNPIMFAGENISSNVENLLNGNGDTKPKIGLGLLIRRQKREKLLMQTKEASANLKELLQKNDEYSANELYDAQASSVTKSVTVDHENGRAFPVDPLSVGCENEVDADGLYQKKKKRMFAVLLSYSGKDYLGLQHNAGFHTIEGELLKAMFRAGLITAAEQERVQSISFQRAARTDKGVSAARQVISVKLPVGTDEEKQQQQQLLNSLLPPAIRILDIRRVTRSFNSKNWCDYRTYSYLTPSYAFAPCEVLTNNEYRISETVLAAVRQLFSNYAGTKNFHNFTIRKKPTEANAKRFVHSMTVNDPFVREGVEWLLIKVRGQSFMMHQIRKMIGLVISICRGVASPSMLLEAFTHTKVDTPRAPGLGLVLEQPHYDIYNKRFGSDGHHQTLDFDNLEDDVERFRRAHIDSAIIESELAHHSMLDFLKLLHEFPPGFRDAPDSEDSCPPTAPIEAAAKNEEEEGQGELRTMRLLKVDQVKADVDVQVNKLEAVEENKPCEVEPPQASKEFAKSEFVAVDVPMAAENKMADETKCVASGIDQSEAVQTQVPEVSGNDRFEAVKADKSSD